MKLEAFSLRDTKAETFAAPFFVPNEAIAMRFISQEVLDTRTNLGKYPADFMLYRVGTYDTDTAQLTAVEVISLVCPASSLLPRATTQPAPATPQEF